MWLKRSNSQIIMYQYAICKDMLEWSEEKFEKL